MNADGPDPMESVQVPAQQTGEAEQPIIVIVDDDAAVREALAELIASVGLQTICFASIREVLDADVLERPGCLILDVRMPGESGMDLQDYLAQSGNPKPIIFLTGHGDIPTTVRAMKAGAVDFLTKPVQDQTLLDAVSAGIAIDAARRAEAVVVKRNVERIGTLTPRERQILREVVRGRLNKQIAFDLGIAEITVKVHRGSIMRKMEVASIGDLVRAWGTLPAPIREADAN